MEWSGSRRFVFLGSLTLVLLAGCEFQRQPNREIPGRTRSTQEVLGEIESMLHSSAASWNGGDLEGFLDDYWRSDSLTFSGATGVTRGWEDLRARYMQSYWAPEIVRDSLRFEGIEVLPLGNENALALGQYVLFQPGEDGGVTSTGFFSLVLRNTDGKWKILHDHTSSTPAAEEPVGGGS